MGVGAFGEIVGESRSPGAHFDAVTMQARSRQDGILWPFGGANVLVAGSGFHNCFKTRLADDFLRELEPGAIPGVGRVHDAMRLLSAQAVRRARQVIHTLRQLQVAHVAIVK